jgi:hypothetical protein
MGIYNPGGGGGGVAGVSSFNARTGAVTLTSLDVTSALTYTPANTASPAFTGNPTAPTQTAGDNSTKLATTAYVDNAVSGAGVSSFNGRTGVVTLSSGDVTTALGYTPTSVTGITGIQSVVNFKTGLALNNVDNTSDANKPVSTATQTALNLKANLASPALTGNPTAPTQSPGDNSTKLATTGYVDAAINVTVGYVNTGLALKADLASPALTGVPTAPTATPGTNTTQIATTAYVDAGLTSTVVYINSGLATKADLASPALTGTPTAPTATGGTNTTQIATTAFVQAAVSSGTAGVTSFNTRTGIVTLTSGDVTSALTYTPANISSPTFTGVPAAPTAAGGTNTTQIATTAFVATAISGFGAVVGPASATNNGFVRFDGTTGKLVKDSAAVVAAADGGTGLTSYTTGDLVQASSSSALAALNAVAVGNVLLSGGIGTTSSWGKVGLTTHVSGTLPVANGGTGITALGTGVATALGIAVGAAGAFVTFNGALGTPSSATLTSATGLPISTGVSGLGTNVATFLATPTSANLAAAVTNETGTGALVFATSPTLVTPILGTPTSGNLSNTTVDGTNAVGFREIPQNSQSTAYTAVLADNGKHIFHPTADNNARTFTIPANSSVAFPVGTCLTFINMINTVTIAITSDTLILSPAGTTGSRTLAANGMATAIKVTSTSWMVSGSGLS